MRLSLRNLTFAFYAFGRQAAMILPLGHSFGLLKHVAQAAGVAVDMVGKSDA